MLDPVLVIWTAICDDDISSSSVFVSFLFEFVCFFSLFLCFYQRNQSASESALLMQIETHSISLYILLVSFISGVKAIYST